MNENILPWVDTETFGLNEHMDPIIEVGIILTDQDLAVIDYQNWLCWGPAHENAYDRLIREAEAGSKDARFVLDMHRKSALFDEASEDGNLMFAVEKEICSWLEDKGATDAPMCGSSVHYDQRFFREQMPNLMDKFHYRIIDTSTIKELCRRYNPPVFARVPPKNEEHRALPDLHETIEEFRFYKDNFIFDGRFFDGVDY